LLPDEIALFCKEKVVPGIGLGISPDEESFTVLTYQLKADTCPHLFDELCRIYEKRPASCRQFPFSYEIDTKSGDTIVGVDLNCPAVSSIIEKTPQIQFEERNSAEKILEMKRIVSNNVRNVWLYDLKKMIWVRFSDLSQKA
jgi:Fe-S-cluster containining protein